MTIIEYKLWTALYIHRKGIDSGCYNVEFGHKHGKAVFSRETVRTLAQSWLKKHGKAVGLQGYKLCGVVPHGRKHNCY